MRVNIRFADAKKDAAALLHIYAPYIEKTAITFETAVPGVEEYEARIAAIAVQFPYLVLEVDGEVAGTGRRSVPHLTGMRSFPSI